MRLGKHPAKRDPRNLKLGSFLDRSKLRTPELALDRAKGLGPFGTYGNLRLGDCTCATWATAIELVTARRGARVRIPDDEVIRMYSAIGGYVDGDPSTDNGASMTTAANYMRQVGLKDEHGNVHKIAAWAQVNHADFDEIQIAIDMFEAIAIGVMLPRTAEDTSKEWDTDGTDGTNGDQVPGSWGGHSDVGAGYDGRLLKMITWGAEQGATLPFWARYTDEIIVGIPYDLVDGRTPVPDALMLDQLLDALRALP